MDIGQLELLDVLVQQRSFKKAARQCFVTTSTLARQVTAMEAELGFPIFTRSAHGIVLTEQGEIFYRETRELVRAYKIFYRETRELVRAYKAAVESGRSADRDHRTVRAETDSSAGNRTEPMKRLSRAEYEQLFSDFGSQVGDTYSLLFPSAADFRLPQRKPVSHKYSYGRALIIAGSVGFSGAPVLAANACERSGAGLTHLVVPDAIYPITASRCDGAVVTPLHSAEGGSLSMHALDRLLPLLERASACVIGPGLGLGNDSETIVAEVIRSAKCPLVLDADALTICGRPLVLDADALTICGRTPGLLSSCRSPLILTPHEGEFRRLGGDLSGGRLAGALSFCATHGEVILILKGYGTLVCRGGEVSVNPTGSPAMAKGGSGDVLCGILCALLAQGFDPLFSSRCAVFLHGLAGDLARDALGEYCVTPSDLIRFLPDAFRQLTDS